VYLNTLDKDFLKESMAAALESGAEMPSDLGPAEFDLGVAHERITTTVDVVEYIDLKRKAMSCHGSQISESSFFLAMAPEMFRIAFGQEWYILVDAPPGTVETDVFAGL
jgi:LmbE family N-acetylglucosaminyl deacetylase